MIALVQGELQIDRLAVQRDVGMLRARQHADRDLAHAKVGPDLVGEDAVPSPLRQKRARHFVEIGVLEVPELDVTQGDLELGAHLPRQKFHRRRLRAVGLLEADLEGHRLRRGGTQRHVGGHRAIFDVRREMHLLEKRIPTRLEVDGLPHAAGIAVALLAVEAPVAIGHARRCIPGPQGEFLRSSPFHVVRELELERRVAPRVLAETVLAKPAGRIVVAGADNEEHALPLPGLRHRDVPTVPADVGLVLHAGKLASPGERHDDGLAKLLVARGEPFLLHAGIGLVERELPVPIEVHPLGTLPVRPRVLGQRNLRSSPKPHHHNRQHRQFLHVISFKHLHGKAWANYTTLTYSLDQGR